MTNNKIVTFHILLALQFVLVAAGMLVNIKVGLFSMIIILSFTTICLIQLNNDEQTNWKAGQNIMTYMFTIWLCFYLLEILNPNNVLAAWKHQPYTLCADTFNMRLCCSARCPHKKRHRAAINHLVGIRPRLYDKRLLAKKLWFQLQRPLFPARAGRMAYTYHLVGYPLFFLLLRRSKLRSTCRHVRCSLCHLRLLCESPNGYAFTSSASPSGDFTEWVISGTRAAMGVIMGGMLMITVIAKNWKALLAGIFISISVFVFFSYTNIGSGNQYIHKMRSSFHPSEDASYQVRVENRQE